MSDITCHLSCVGCHPDMEKDNFFTQAMIEPKLFYPANYNKSEFAKKQRKMFLTTTMTKIGPPHKIFLFLAWPGLKHIPGK